MSDSDGIVAVIPARGGSKGVPRKNIRPLAGKPLIAYAIHTALASRLIDKVVVSTDDEEIASVARQYGAEVPFMRPKELAHDDSPEWLTWQHTIRTLNEMGSTSKMKVFVCVSPTAPLRSVEDVDACIQNFLESDDADTVLAVTPADQNPYFTMVNLNDEGYAQLVVSSDPPIYRRQDAPPVFAITPVAYVLSPDFILSAGSMLEGKVKAVVIPPERAVDIDTELDFKLAELLLSESHVRVSQPSEHGSARRTEALG